MVASGTLRVAATLTVVCGLGYSTIIAAETVESPRARVVEAIIDTKALAAVSDFDEIPAGVPSGQTIPRTRGEAALAEFTYDWATGLPGWEISFHPGRAGVLGYTFVQERRIEVYVRDEMSDGLLAHVIAHEIGHAIDVTHNSGDDRRRWQELRGIGDEPWWPGNGATDFSTGAGDFAESFAAWQVGDDSFRSKLADPPSESDNRLMEELSTG